MTAVAVNRTCQYCKVDKGSLQQGRFYDWNAKRGTLKNNYPISNGGLLNQVLFCGDEKCLKHAMALRKAELEQ